VTTFSLSSNLDEVLSELALARAQVDPTVQAEMAHFGPETLDVEKQLAPKGKRHRDRGKTLAESIYLKVGTLGFQTRTSKRYANIIDRGGVTGAHPILPKRKKALAFNGIVTKSVHHPGSHYRANLFAERTVAVMEPRVTKGLGEAVQASIERALS
jgi:hypothetical protein